MNEISDFLDKYRYRDYIFLHELDEFLATIEDSPTKEGLAITSKTLVPRAQFVNFALDLLLERKEMNERIQEGALVAVGSHQDPSQPVQDNP